MWKIATDLYFLLLMNPDQISKLPENRLYIFSDQPRGPLTFYPVKVPGSGLTYPLHPLMSHGHQCCPDILTVNSGFLPALLNRRTGTVFYRQWLTERYNSVMKDCRFLFLQKS